MPINTTIPEAADNNNQTTHEESKAQNADRQIVYQIKIKVNKDRRKVRKFFLKS